MLAASAAWVVMVPEPGSTDARGAAAAAREPARRDSADPRHADPAGRDHARPLRCPVRRRGRAVAAVRAIDPAHGTVRARRPAQRAGRRCARRRDPPGARPLRGPAGRTLLLVVGAFGVCMIVFGLSRWFWLSLDRAGRQRLRRHDLDEHPLDDRRARHAERASRTGRTPSRTSSSARRTSSARSSRAPPRRCSARCRRSWRAAP